MRADKLLLNVCCAPCSFPIIDRLATEQKPPPVLFFYAPNIFPRAEYDQRLAAVEKVASIYQLKLIAGVYDHNEWLEFIEDNLPLPPRRYQENEERCRLCLYYRIRKTAELGWQKGFKAISLTLSVSRFKDVKHINEQGEREAAKGSLEYVNFDLDPHQAHETGRQLSKLHAVYRQKYCGCEFSLK